MTPDLRRQVLERLDEIEATATATDADVTVLDRLPWTADEERVYRGDGWQAALCDGYTTAAHVAQHSPSAVLRWVQALRGLAEGHAVDRYRPEPGPDDMVIEGYEVCSGCHLVFTADKPACAVIVALAVALGLAVP